ncbi:MAG TPA: glycoside hydrolase family 13 protein [Bacteroidota bacterium]|nr:glycoside hydrolase family 13 protein [Bacteroidota bacterium]
MNRFTLSFLLLASIMTAFAQPQVPDWAKDAIWYQIFPERFRNANPANDPTAEELEIPAGREWRISPWTSDWYKLQPWEEKHSKNFYENVFDRRYGGDLEGVLEKLDYLADLGITAIYFNPVFEAHSLHKYDASSYHHIDNNFGPNPKGDLEQIRRETDNPSTWKWTAADSVFLKLIRETHKRGIRIIIDGVFNHSGTRFFAFEDIQKNQQSSRYAHWYDVVKWDDPSTPEDEFDWKGWWGYKPLPEFHEDENGFVPAVKEYFFNITRRWMDPNGDGDPEDGIDGWRLDVANEVSEKFWREWRTLVKSINPAAYIVGEIWDDASKWLSGDQFDAVMNYRFARAGVKFFIHTGSKKTTVTAFDAELAEVRKGYQDHTNYVLQNLYDSHDTDRLISMIANPNRDYDRDASPRTNPNYDVSKPKADHWQTLRLMALFQMTYLGAPMIYYGTEAGMWGADDPDDRKPMVWEELKYEDETSHPLPGKTRSRDRVKFDTGLFEYYKKLITLRKEHAALRRGSFKTLLTDDKNDVYVFEREHGGEKIIVVINNSRKHRLVELRVDGEYEHLLNLSLTESSLSPPPSRGAYAPISTLEILRVEVGGKEGRVLRKKK